MINEDTLTEKEAIKLLKKYSKGNEKAFTIIKEHSLAVEKTALEVCSRIKSSIKIDLHLVAIGSILHDIGRFDYPPGKNKIKHGIQGRDILLKESLNKCSRIAESHIGIGITKDDIIEQNLPIPIKDYLPISNEEKIISYADKINFGTKLVDEEAVIERFINELGLDYGKRVVSFFDDIHKLFK